MVCAGKYELLKVNQVVGEAAATFRQEEEVALRPEHPGVETLLSVKGRARVKRVEVLAGRVLVEGGVELQLTYIACVPEKPVYAAHLEVPFSHSLNVAGALPGMNAHVTALVKANELRPKASCGREFTAVVALDLQVKVTEHKEIEVLVEAPSGVEVKETKRLRVDDVVATTSAEVLALGECAVPEEKPAVAEVLDLLTETEITRAETATDEVYLSGKLHAHVVYRAANAAGSVYHLECVVPFGQTVAVAGVKEKMTVQVEARTLVAEAAPKDAPSRALAVEALISCRILVVEPRQLDVVTAVTGAAVVEKAKLRVETVVGENSATVALAEVAVVPPADPPAKRILVTEPLGVTIVAAEVIDDIVVTRGRAGIRVIYAAATPDEKVYAADAQLDFTARVSVRGAKPGYGVHILPTIDYAVARVKEGSIVVDAAVTVLAKVTEMVSQEVITCIKLPEVSPAPPVTLIRHPVAPGDTFYNLAERYGTTVEAIMAANPGVDPDNLQVGQIINIPVAPGDPA